MSDLQSSEELPLETLSQEETPPNRTGRRRRNGRRKYVRYSPLSLVLLAICAAVFSFSMFGLLEQPIYDYAGKVNLGSLGFEDAFFDDGSDDANVLKPSPNDAVDGSKWQQIEPSKIDKKTLPFLQKVHFDILKQQNEDSVAWMYWPTTTDVKGLPFNMAVVQTTNNEFYLNRSFDLSNNANGWIYADYRCDMSNLISNRNTIIYGHARSYLMFGGLRFLNTKTKWQEDGYNHFIYINTPNERTVWQVFSWYETTTEFNYIQTYFSGDIEYMAFLNTLQAQNTIPAFEQVELDSDSKILTLSTCKGVNSDVRVAIHAVLVKHEWLPGREPNSGSEPTLPDYD